MQIYYYLLYSNNNGQIDDKTCQFFESHSKADIKVFLRCNNGHQNSLTPLLSFFTLLNCKY